jgi:preprotein translocase subunit Sss1
MVYKEWTEKEKKKRMRERKDNIFVFIAKYLWKHYKTGLIGTLVGLPLLIIGLVAGNDTYAILGIIGLAILVISNYIEKVKHNDFARGSDDNEWEPFPNNPALPHLPRDDE